MKKSRKLIGLLLCMAILITGCEAVSYDFSQMQEDVTGITYTIDMFDNSGTLMMKTHGERISVEPIKVKEYTWDKDGSWVATYSASSVITINIDGEQIQSCGDTCVFYQDGLEPDAQFEPVTNISSESDNGLLDSPMIAGTLNDIRNVIGKSRVVVIKSQLGNPIYVFSGDSVYWEVAEELPKFTKLSIDGKLLYIHRANFQIIDKALLEG